MQSTPLSSIFRCLIPGITAVLIIASFTGCLGVKTSAGNSRKSGVETFFVGDEGTQYFIKPLIFRDAANNELQLDITFRYKDRLKDSATVNASLIGKEIVRNVDSLKISTDSVSAMLHPFRYLFADRARDQFNSRFSTREDLKQVAELFNHNNWKIILYRQGKQIEYSSPKATSKQIGQLKYRVFALF